jgi:membrane protein required for colicin V production
LNWLDIVITIFLIGSAVIGFRSGLIKALLGLAGIIIGVILAGRFYVPFSERLSFISSTGVAKVIAFAIILIAVIVVAGLIAFFLRRAASIITLGWVDRLGGVVFGVLMAALFSAAVLAAWVKFFGIAAVVADSGIAHTLLDSFPVILGLLPRDFDSIRSFFY